MITADFQLLVIVNNRYLLHFLEIDIGNGTVFSSV